MLFAKASIETRVGPDQAFDILSIINPSGIHDEGTIQTVSGPELSLSLSPWMNATGHKVCIRRRKNIAGDRFIAPKQTERFLPCSLGYGQKQFRPPQMVDLGHVPSLDCGIAEIGIFMSQRNKIIEDY